MSGICSVAQLTLRKEGQMGRAWLRHRDPSKEVTQSLEKLGDRQISPLLLLKMEETNGKESSHRSELGHLAADSSEAAGLSVLQLERTES